MKFKLEGLEQTVANLEDLSRATQKNVVRRTLKAAAEPVAKIASDIAPHQSGRLAFSIGVATQLTRRHRGEGRQNEVEVHIGPVAGLKTLGYASAVEFGTIVTPAQPYMRPAWENSKELVVNLISKGMATEVDRAASRAARKAARLAA